ncbi:hypothetical protein PSPO01_15757 [Paraphaeosphaeria sporulosa]
MIALMSLIWSTKPSLSWHLFSALILTVILVIFFLVRYYLFESFLMRKCYGGKYLKLNEVNRRGFVNHHIAGIAKIIVAAVGAYPFIDVTFGTATVHTPIRRTRTSTFPSHQKVDIYRFSVKTRLKCLLKSVSQRPLSAAGVVAGALPCFVFQLFAELKSFQNGPCATQIFTFGRRPQPPLRQGDSLATPCSCKIWALARPEYKGSPCAELRHYPTEHRLSTRKEGSQQSLTIHNPGDQEEGQAWLCFPTTPISSDTGMAKPSTKALLAQSHGLGSTEHRLSTPPTLSYSLSHGTQLPLNTHKGSTLMYTHCSVSPAGRGAVA